MKTDINITKIKEIDNKDFENQVHQLAGCLARGQTVKVVENEKGERLLEFDSGPGLIRSMAGPIYRLFSSPQPCLEGVESDDQQWILLEAGRIENRTKELSDDLEIIRRSVEFALNHATKSDLLEVLPDGALSHIQQHLDVNDLRSLSATSRVLKRRVDKNRAASLRILIDNIIKKARSIEDWYERVEVIARIAGALGPLDPRMGSELIDEALGYSKYFDDWQKKTTAFVQVIKAAAVFDFDRGVELTLELGEFEPIFEPERFEEHWTQFFQSLLICIQEGAQTDSFEAERYLEQYESDFRVRGLVKELDEAYVAFAAASQDRAEEFVEKIQNQEEKDKVFAAKSKSLVTVDMEEALQSAEKISDEKTKIQTLMVLAPALYRTDPERAEKLFSNAKKFSGADRIEVLAAMGEALHSIDESKKGNQLFEEAIELANTVEQFLSISKVLRSIDPDWANQLIEKAIQADKERKHTEEIVATLAAIYPKRAIEVAEGDMSALIAILAVLCKQVPH